MAVKVGLIGRPGSGKSTLFNLVTGAQSSQSFLTAGKKPDIATAQVPDDRLEKLATIFRPKKVTHAQFEILDLPGFSAKTDKKLVTAALGNYRTCEALAIVVNLFDLAEGQNAAQNTKELFEELVLLDSIQIESLLPMVKKRSAGREAYAAEKAAILTGLLPKLEEGLPAYRAGLTESDQALIGEYALITTRPFIVVANLADDMLGGGSPEEAALCAVAESFGAGYVAISAKTESELAQIEDETERRELMNEFGIIQPGLYRFIHSMFNLLGLKTFFTGGDKEVRAWTIRSEGTALDAAGAIHSDIARGFIRAEIYPFEILIEIGGLQAFKGTDKFKLVGKDFVISDGDFVVVRFNV